MDVGSVIGGGGIVTLILAIGGGIKWYVGRQDAQKDPIPKDAAAVALSANAVEVANVVLGQVNAEMATMRAEMAGMRGTNRVLETRVAAAEETIQHHETMFGAAISYIEALLTHIRDGRKRPAPPPPVDLRDLIDPSLRD